MSFSERLANGTFPVALEITPPTTSMPAVLTRRASALGKSIPSTDVVERSNRQSSLHAASQLLRRGYDPIWHLVTNGTSPKGIELVLGSAVSAGLNQALFIRGDNTQNHGVTVKDAIYISRGVTTGLAIGVAFNQHAKNGQDQMNNAAAKVEAGALYIQTQPVFDFPQEIEVFSKLERACPEAKIVAMCMPLMSLQTAEDIARRLKIRICPSLLSELESQGQETGWQRFQNTIEQLQESQFIDGLIIMTFEIDPSAETKASIVRSLKATGLV